MFKVLIADDEPAALTLISSIIEKKCPDFEVTATAENGKEALDKVRGLHPDLVISDVKMPLMSGIELVSAIRQEVPEIYSVIVSGYAEFEYAQSAIHSRVCDYILKPIVPSVMQKTIDQIGKKLKKDYYNTRKQVVRKICDGMVCEDKMMTKYFEYKEYYGAIIRRNGLPRRLSITGGMEIYSEAEELFTVYGRDEMEALYLIPKEMVLDKTFECFALNLLYKMQTKEQYVTMVYGQNSFLTGELQNVIKKLYHTLDEISVVGLSQTVTLEEGYKKTIVYQHEEINNVLTRFEYLIKEYQNGKFREELGKLFTIWKLQNKPQLWMEYISRQILYLVRKYNENMLSMTESEYMMEEAFFNAVSFDELTENLFEIYDIFMNDHQETFKVDSQEFFNSITDWLKGNLAESISLQNVCSHFGISQTYLSKMFRKYTEQSFSRYFTELRMRKAMELMREQPELFIKDIAVMVGYTDQFYFSRIFRSVEGVSPMEYMKQNLVDVLLPN